MMTSSAGELKQLALSPSHISVCSISPSWLRWSLKVFENPSGVLVLALVQTSPVDEQASDPPTS